MIIKKLYHMNPRNAFIEDLCNLLREYNADIYIDGSGRLTSIRAENPYACTGNYFKMTFDYGVISGSLMEEILSKGEQRIHV